MAHNSPGMIIGYPEGGLLTAKRATIKRDQVGGGARGKVYKFSKGSRWRFMKLMGTVKRSVLPIFVTLTYPDKFPVNKKDWSIHLDRMDKRISRKGWGAIVRKEFQKRKSGENVGKYVPHFHLLLWGATVEEARRYIPQAWYEIVGSSDERHLAAGTSCEALRTWKGVIHYVSKYMAKVDTDNLQAEFPDGVGRFWYVWNSQFIPWAQIEEYSAGDQEVSNFFRLMRRYAHIKARSKNRSMTILCNNPAVWLNKLL